MGVDLSKHNWREVQDALYDLQAHTEQEEPQAVNFLAAIEEVLGGLPETE